MCGAAENCQGCSKMLNASSRIAALAASDAMFYIQTTLLFVLTALAEIVGCYLPYLWLRENKSPWLLLPAALSLALFTWLLSLHPTAAGRVYAAYGGLYITVAILWLWFVDGHRPRLADWAGVSLCLLGMAVIMFAPKAD